MKSKLFILFFILPLSLFASDWTLELRGAYYRPVSKKLRESYSGGWLDYQLEASYAYDCNMDIFVAVNWVSKKKKLETGYFDISCDSSSTYYSSYSDYFSSYSYYTYDYSYDYSYSYESSYSPDSDCCSGHFIHDQKRIWILPLTLGSRYTFHFTPCFELYVGAGACLTFVDIQYDSHHFEDYASKIGMGAVLKSGARYNWGEYTFIDFFVDYFIQEMSLSRSERDLGLDDNHVNLSGLKIGLGIGVYF